MDGRIGWSWSLDGVGFGVALDGWMDGQVYEAGSMKYILEFIYISLHTS